MHKPRSRELLYISIVFLLTVVAWIIVDISSIRKNKASTVNYQKSINTTIIPMKNLDVLKKLEDRK